MYRWQPCEINKQDMLILANNDFTITAAGTRAKRSSRKYELSWVRWAIIDTHIFISQSSTEYEDK